MPIIFQGGVSFEFHNKTIPHRFEVIITDEDKTVLWIEDLQSKKQWQTAALQPNGFVTEDNAIPKATMQDYAERFATCLGSTNTSDNCTRTLTTKGNDRVLVLSFPFQLALRDLALDYTFTMNAVSLDRIDILGARVRDVEDKVSAFPEDRIRHLEQENEKLKAETQHLLQQLDQLSCTIVRIPVFAQATLAADHNSTDQTLTFFGNVQVDQVLIWFAGDGNTSGVIQFVPTGYIQFLKEGVYALDIAVVHESLPYRSAFIELKQSETTLSRGALHTARTTTPLRYILKAKPNDKIHVLFNGPGTAYQVGSYITITKLN